MNPAFESGFKKAIALFRAGDCVEVISQRPDYDASAYGRGLFAGCEAILGWLDIAAREARAHGFSREAADALALTAQDA